MERFTALVVVIFSSLGLGNRQHLLWQADLLVRSLTITEEKGNLAARVVVASESGEALSARLEILLPVGVGIVTLGSGCKAGPSRTGISEPGWSATSGTCQPDPIANCTS